MQKRNATVETRVSHAEYGSILTPFMDRPGTVALTLDDILDPGPHFTISFAAKERSGITPTFGGGGAGELLMTIRLVVKFA